MGVTLSFKESLEKRTKNMQKQDDRRNQFHSNFDFSGMQPDGGGDGGFVDLEGGGSAGSGGQAVGRAYIFFIFSFEQFYFKMMVKYYIVFKLYCPGSSFNCFLFFFKQKC